MRSSGDRILTTHVGSLPRNERLSDLLIAEERGDPIDKAMLAQEVQAAVSDVVGRQIAAGIDVINDGEQPRVGFQTYVPQRMKGFGGSSKRPRPLDYLDFPDYAKTVGGASRTGPRSAMRRWRWRRWPMATWPPRGPSAMPSPLPSCPSRADMRRPS